MAASLEGAVSEKNSQSVRSDDSIAVEPADLKVDDGKKLSFSHFAEVFRGSLRGDDVLVKRASKLWRKTQGRHSAEDFLSHTVGLFHQEFDLVRSLNHPNIVQTYGLCWPDSLDIALVLECLPTCLQVRLPRLPYLTFSQAVDIDLDISKATEYLHRRQLVHRDISVSNVFLGLGATGNRLLAKLSDFSNVGALTPDNSTAGATADGGDGGGDCADSSLDVHDLGALVFCIAIRVERIDLDDKDYLLKMLNAPQLQEFLPLKGIISDCMAKDPKKRPSISALIGQLQTMRSSEEYRKSDLQTKKPPAVLGIPSVGSGQAAVKAAFGEQPKQLSMPTEAAQPSVTSAQASAQLPVGLLAVRCPVCMNDVDKSQVWTIMGCQHDVCYSCLRQHYKQVILNLPLQRLVCPVCGQPDFEDFMSEVAQKHFSDMDELLQFLFADDMKTFHSYKKKHIMQTLVHTRDYFQCAHCSHGYIKEHTGCTDVICPASGCDKSTCYECRKPSHPGLSCRANMEKLLREFEQYDATTVIGKKAGCPKCFIMYEIIRGPLCMHYKCEVCLHEYCTGCRRPMLRGSHCKRFTSCAARGLHTHHPRNCSYYLRDFTSKQLQELLGKNDVEFAKDKCVVKSQRDSNHCGLLVEKERRVKSEDTLGKPCFEIQRVEEPCGDSSPHGCGGLCEKHYQEYLVDMVIRADLDPVDVMPTRSLVLVIQREELVAPGRGGRRTDEEYRAVLLKFIHDHIPLHKEVQPPGFFQRLYTSLFGGKQQQAFAYE